MPKKGNDSRDEDNQHPDERRELYRLAKAATEKTKSIYESAFNRRIKHLRQSRPLAESLFSAQGRLIVGLGGENVLETGITLQHTYGVPTIPGSALKGLSSHYCDQVWGNKSVYQEGSSAKQDADKFKLGGEWHRALFGTTDDSGHVIFHDAWITPESLEGHGKQGLVLDVMTPHHGDYYAGDKDKQGKLAAPTDFDDPNPITFLSVTGAFHVALSCDVDSDVGEKWTKLAMRLLTEALQHWGVGGKTNAGYGRLKAEPQPDGPPPKVRADQQAAWLKELSDTELVLVAEDKKEIMRRPNDFQGRASLLKIGQWYVLSGTRTVRWPD